MSYSCNKVSGTRHLRQNVVQILHTWTVHTKSKTGCGFSFVLGWEGKRMGVQSEVVCKSPLPVGIRDSAAWIAPLRPLTRLRINEIDQLQNMFELVKQKACGCQRNTSSLIVFLWLFVAAVAHVEVLHCFRSLGIRLCLFRQIAGDLSGFSYIYWRVLFALTIAMWFFVCGLQVIIYVDQKDLCLI